MAPLQRGFDLPKSKMMIGVYPVVMSNGIKEYHTEFKAKAPGVVTGRSGTIGSVFFIDTDYWPHNTTLWVTDFNGNHPKFIYHLYKKVGLGRIGTGTGVPTLNRNDVHSEIICVPKSKEQIKISEFFDSLDIAITLHQRKLDRLKELKKGYLQQMFPQVGVRTPRVRFAEFNGEWQEQRLREFTSSYSGGTPPVGKSEYYGGNIPFIRSSEINYDSTELFLTEYGLNNSSARMVNVGDILYALYGATSGKVGRSRICGAINQAILAIKPTGIDDAEFLAQWLRYKKSEIVSTYLQGGQGNLSGNLIKNITVSKPAEKGEQEKIGVLFHIIDRRITTQMQKIEQLKYLKTTYLKKMFI